MKKQTKRSKGHPRSFETEEDFIKAFEKYINHCKRSKKLANIAGFCGYQRITRETFYKQKEYYSDTYSVIQDILEDSAINHHNGTMGIFYLKNKFNYRDKQEFETHNTNHNYNFEKELEELANDDETTPKES